MKVTKEQYAEFQKHYAWVLLRAPDYRLGQAFLNYFPEVSRIIIEDCQSVPGGTLLEFKLYNETNQETAQEIINAWIEQ